MTSEKAAILADAATKVPTFSRLHDSGRTVAGSDEDIRGRMVKDRNGRKIGKIEHLLIDEVDQKVRFLEVASGGFLHLGETKSLIPVEAITRITKGDVHIGPTREHVAGAPAYDPDLVNADARYLYDLYPYYGYRDSGESVAPWIASWTNPRTY
jgi:sporulation protein YlmC with PRC-barrel domain